MTAIAELLNDYSSVRKQHMWDFFSGSSLDPRWSWKAGSGGVVISQGIKDEVDGGYQLQMTNGHEGTYDFNNIRQYNHDGAIIIGVCKTFHSDGQFGIGFRGDRDAAFNRHYTRLFIKNGSNNIEGMTADGSGVAYHDTGVTSDTNWHTLKIVLTAGATHFSIDGVLRDSSTGSENETDAKVQPQFYSSTAGSSQGGNIRYLEAYNT